MGLGEIALLDGLDLLRLEAATTFVLDDRRRILRENDPDQSSGPRVAFLSWAEGGVAHVRADLDDRMAAKIVDIFSAEPPWLSPDVLPNCLAEVLALLEPTAHVEGSLSYRMPNGLPVDGNGSTAEQAPARRSWRNCAETAFPATLSMPASPASRISGHPGAC